MSQLQISSAGFTGPRLARSGDRNLANIEGDPGDLVFFFLHLVGDLIFFIIARSFLLEPFKLSSKICF